MTADALPDPFVTEELDELLLEELLPLEAWDVEPDPVELLADEDAAEPAVVLAPALVAVPGCVAAAVAPRPASASVEAPITAMVSCLSRFKARSRRTGEVAWLPSMLLTMDPSPLTSLRESWELPENRRSG